MSGHTLVVAKGRGGLGNRCLALVPLIDWAARYRAALFVDWRDGLYASEGHNAFDKAFRLSGVELATEEVLGLRGKVAPDVWSGSLGLSANALLRRFGFSESSRFFHKTISANLRLPPAVGVNVHCSVQDVPSLRPLLTRVCCAAGRHRSRIDWLRKTLANRLEFSADVAAATSEVNSRICFSGSVLGVHFRNSDRTSNIESVIAKVKNAIQKDGYTEVFLATDDEAAVRVFRTELDLRVAVYEKCFPSKGGPIHVARQEIGAGRILLDACVELSMLAQCSGLMVNPSSTFGILAAVLGKQPLGGIFFSGESWLRGTGRTVSWELLG